MNTHANHAALFVEAIRDFARADGVNRAFARGSGLFLQKSRGRDALELLDLAATECARTAPPTHLGKTPEQHAVECAKTQPARMWFQIICTNQRPTDLREADDEWHTPEAVRAMVTHSEALARIHAA